VLYDVAIVNQSEPNRLLLASSPNLSLKEMNTPDAVFDIFRLRLNNMLVEEVSVTSDQPKVLKKSEAHEQKTVLIHSVTKDSPLTQEKTIVEKDGRQTIRTLKMLPSKPGWKVLFKHKSGSLEAVVDQVRRRNLLISFSILILLATAVLLVLVEVRRTRNLAAQQMNFVAGISHELRTPLSVICSAAENLSDAVVEEPNQVQKYGEMIRDEGRRLSEMIQQVLDFAGIQSDRKRERVRITLQELVAKVVRDFSKIRPTIIETDLPMDLPPVFADQAAIESALMNLIDNACKYSGNTPMIRIEARESGNPKKVSLRVTDHGAGISADDLPHIFEPFYRGMRSQRIRGTGLGLSLVKQVAESHGGGVSVESVEGKGSSFTFYLPANTDEVERS
jgi:signal transduction histidine kinase